MSKLTDKLAEFGVDVAMTMDRFVDDEDLYVNCLNIFLNDEKLGLLEKAIKNKDYEEATEYTKEIKGFVGDLGLEPLTENLSELSEKLAIEEYENVGDILKGIFEKIERLKKIEL